jgi:LPXTG-motif cell wall-anchored protein
MESAANTSSENSTAWVGLILGAIGIYLIFRKKNTTTSVEEKDSTNIDSYSKFRKTPMGKSIDEQLDEQGIELSDAQIKLLDECLKGLSSDDYKVIEKASQFIKKEDIYKALSKDEMKVFLPVRKKIMKCLDETLTP